LTGKAEPCLTTGGVAQGKEGAAKFLRGLTGKAEPCLTTGGVAKKEGVARKFKGFNRQGGAMPHNEWPSLR